jgi:alkaline phosphatase D
VPDTLDLRTFSRRDVLRFGGAAVVVAAAPAWGGRRGTVAEYDYRGPLGSPAIFSHGVASGDPLPDGIVLWTRVTPDHPGRVEVFWEIALDAGFQERVAAGSLVTDERDDHTVNVDVRGLIWGRDYHYRFLAEGRESPVGRARLAPAPGDEVERVRVGLASCSSLAHGFFHAYAKMAAQPDLDVVLHLGDYIYEYGDGGFGDLRGYEPPHEILTLDDYRARHAQYKREPQLQLLHQQVPFVTVWDDHEVADDAWRRGAVNHQDDEGGWRRRKLAALRAYFEWMPIRRSAGKRVTRTVHYGDLVDLVMIDTRHTRRAEQAGPLIGPEPVDEPPDRQLLGRKQERWLRRELAESTARWKLIGNQVVMAQLRIPLGGTVVRVLDSWDGYPAARRRFLAMLEEEGIRNVVVCTGDIHASGAAELSDDPFTRPDPLAVEIVTPGISSPFPLPSLVDPVLGANPHLRFAEGVRRGYVVLDIDADRVEAQWWLLDAVENPAGADETLAKVLAVAGGDPHLQDLTPGSPSGAFV